MSQPSSPNAAPSVPDVQNLRKIVLSSEMEHLFPIVEKVLDGENGSLKVHLLNVLMDRISGHCLIGKILTPEEAIVNGRILNILRDLRERVSRSIEQYSFHLAES